MSGVEASNKVRERGMTFYGVREMVRRIDGVIKGLEEKVRSDPCLQHAGAGEWAAAWNFHFFS